MRWLLIAAVVILGVAFIVQTLRIWLLRRSVREITRGFARILETDTNNLITLSTRDRYMRGLASTINQQLRLLRAQRQKHLSGDRELKDAVTSISHDLRTPLTAICGYLDLLENTEKPEEADRYLRFIRNRVDAMKHLTEEMLRYSVILCAGEPQWEDVCLNSVLEESLAVFYGALMERHIVPVIQIPEKQIIRPLDKASLSRIFSNVLSNALKYSDGDLSVSLTQSGTVTFSNSAAGLDETQVGKLFNRFFTVEAARNSTGLGLSIAKKLTEQMGGTIHAEYSQSKLSIVLSFPQLQTDKRGIP